MDLSFGTQFLQAALFGLVVSAVFHLIIGPVQPWPWRAWLGGAWVLACLCWIILFGLIKAP